MNGAKEAPKVRILDRNRCICYPVQFWKDKNRNVLDLLDSDSKVNAMTLVYVAQLGLKVWKIDVNTQKIDDSLLATYNIVIVAFQIFDTLGGSRFFQKTCLLTNISMEVVLSILFLTLNNADVQFAKKELIWKTYTTEEALLTTYWVEFIDQNEFAKAELDENIEAFVVHVSSLGLRMTIQLVTEAQLALLLAEKVTIPAKYSNFADMFLKQSANIFPKWTGVNEHTIELGEGKQPPYGPIYSLGLVELETFKIYIKSNLANGFIGALKSPAGSSILFVHKPDGSFCLCVNYQRLNNLMIKNCYLLPLIGKSLNRLSWAKQFIYLDLTSAYYQIRLKEGNK